MVMTVEDRAVKLLSRDDIVTTIEREAQSRLGMSAAEMLAAFMRGQLAEPGRVGDLLVLADLLPEDDVLVAGG